MRKLIDGRPSAVSTAGDAALLLHLGATSTADSQDSQVALSSPVEKPSRPDRETPKPEKEPDAKRHKKHEDKEEKKEKEKKDKERDKEKEKDGDDGEKEKGGRKKRMFARERTFLRR